MDICPLDPFLLPFAFYFFAHCPLPSLPFIYLAFLNEQ